MASTGDYVYSLTSEINNIVSVSTSSTTYSGSETDDIEVTISNGTISATLKPMWFESTNDFPSVGSSNLLYVDTETNSLYIYNPNNATYIKIITDWQDIDEINGGGA